MPQMISPAEKQLNRTHFSGIMTHPSAPSWGQAVRFGNDGQDDRFVTDGGETSGRKSGEDVNGRNLLLKLVLAGTVALAVLGIWKAGRKMTHTKEETGLRGVMLDSFSEPCDLALEPAGRDTVSIRRVSTGEVLGKVSRLPESASKVELYDGKGGFQAIVTGPQGTVYFGLPGSTIDVDGVNVELRGKPIPNSVDAIDRPEKAPIQTETPHAVILGAGLATRFMKVAGDETGVSKPGTPLVGDRSVIRLIADQLVSHGFTDIFINTYSKRDALKASLEGLEGGTIRYLDEPAPSGTAGGLRQVFSNPEKFPGVFSPDKPLLVVQGDAVTDADFSALMQAHKANNAAITIGCMIKPDEDVDKFGIVATDHSGEGQSGKVEMFLEKPSLEEAGDHRLANTGFYIFAPETFPVISEVYGRMLAEAQAKALEEGQPVPDEVLIDFAKDLFPVILAKAKAGEFRDKGGNPMPFWAQEISGYWSDIGNPTQYVQTVRDIYSGLVDVELPENPDEFYTDGIVYWPGARERAAREGATVSGNAIVAVPREDAGMGK